MDGDDVGVLQLGAQFAFAAEQFALVVAAGAAVPAAQHLDGEQLARVAMCVARNTRANVPAPTPYWTL